MAALSQAAARTCMYVHFVRSNAFPSLCRVELLPLLLRGVFKREDLCGAQMLDTRHSFTEPLAPEA